jgi:hypothetical protein
VTYYRPSPWRAAWGAVIALALAVALGLAARATVDAIRENERAKVRTEGGALLRLALEHSQRLAYERDSLALLVAQRDTVLVTRIRTIRDTAWLPADTSPVVRLAACRAELDELATACEQFRRTAVTALAKADTMTRRDSAALAGLSLQLAAVRRADSLKAAQLAGRSRWRTIARGVCAGSLAANVFTLTR